MKRLLNTKNAGAPVIGACFGSLQAWQDFAAASGDDVKWQMSRTKRAEQRWDYGMNYSKARKMIAHGWTDGAKQVLDAAGGLTVLQDQAERVAVDYAPTGFFADVNAALAGEVDCYLQAEYQEQPQQPVITLLVGNGALYRMDAPEFTKRGAALLTVVNLLEAAGVRVDLYAYALNFLLGVRGKDGHDLSIFQAYKVKDADQAVNLEALAAVFAHPATHRRLAFRVIEILADGEDTPHNHYGATDTPSRELAAELLGDGSAPYVVPAFGDIPSHETVASLAKQYLDALAQQGALNQDQVNDLKAAL